MAANSDTPVPHGVTQRPTEEPFVVKMLLGNELKRRATATCGPSTGCLTTRRPFLPLMTLTVFSPVIRGLLGLQLPGNQGLPGSKAGALCPSMQPLW